MLHLDPHVQSGKSLHQANTISTLQEHKHQERRIFIYCDPTKENSAGTQPSLNCLLNGFLFHIHFSPSQTPNKQRTFFRRRTIQVSLLKIKAVSLRVSPLQGEQRKMKSPVSNLAWMIFQEKLYFSSRKQGRLSSKTETHLSKKIRWKHSHHHFSINITNMQVWSMAYIK